MRSLARENHSDPELRTTVRKAGAKLIAQLRAELASVMDGKAFSDTSASHGLKDLARGIRLDLLQLVFERCDRPVFLQTPSLPEGDWSEIVNAGLDPEGCRAFFAGQALQKRPFQFQTDGARHASFVLNSPLSGEPRHALGSFIAFERPGCPILFYIFHDPEPFLAIVSPYRGEIVGALFPRRGLMVGLERASKYHAAIARLKALMIEFSPRVADYISDRTAMRPAILSGIMDHFGHNVLNEFEAVHQLISTESTKNLVIRLSGGIDYFDFNELFPELAALPNFTTESPEEMFRAVIENHVFAVRPTCGDYHFSAGLRKRLIAASSDITCYDWLSGKWPVIWFELRGDHRVWTNQVGGIVEIVKSLHARYPNAVAVIGGWSTPLNSPAPESDERFVRSHHDLINKICDALPPEISVINLAGVSTTHKVAAAKWVHSFVAGFGTAIIFPLGVGRATGVAHTNSAFLEELKRDDLLAIFDEIAPVVMMEADPGDDIPSDGHYHTWNYAADWRVMLAHLIDILEPPSRGAVETAR